MVATASSRLVLCFAGAAALTIHHVVQGWSSSSSLPLSSSSNIAFRRPRDQRQSSVATDFHSLYPLRRWRAPVLAPLFSSKSEREAKNSRKEVDVEFGSYEESEEEIKVANEGDSDGQSETEIVTDTGPFQYDDDENREMLKLVTKGEMQDICDQLGISKGGTKMQILKRLREYAAIQSKKEEERIAKRKQIVEEAGTDSKERHEIVDPGVEDEDEKGYFYYSPESFSKKPTTASQADNQSNEFTNATSAETVTKPKQKANNVVTRNTILAPPPPTDTNADGERVVTVYSTTDQNDLTGIAAAQPQVAIQSDPMKSGVGAVENAPWDMQANHKKKKSSVELEDAKEKLVELVSTLLAMSGAHGFQDDGTDDQGNMEAFGLIRTKPYTESTVNFVGFDPSKVDGATLSAASSSLRAGRGQVFDEVIRQFELRAVGYDGMAGDNIEKGGGHYREVSKVRSFLEGFRRSEVRSFAKETATMLLDKLVMEGVEGLDMTLMTMSRSSDDGEFGELNDSLLDFLDDEVRKQQKKVAQMVEDKFEKDNALPSEQIESDDVTEKLWKVEVQDGQTVETFDPRDPGTREAMQDAMVESLGEPRIVRPPIPDSVPEKLLLVLTLLRDRVKTEAAFPNDEKSRNLRILSYCLNASNRMERKMLINNEFGKSFDRLDSFIELVSSSIEYGESTSHQLQPSKKGSLNVRLLRQIRECAKEVHKELSQKAIGTKLP